MLSLFDTSYESEKNFFMENLAILFSARQNITEALTAIRDEVDSKRLKKIIDDLREDVKDGSRLSHALRKTGLVPEHFIALLTIGEETGKLSENFQVLVNERIAEREFRAKIRSALSYPILILVVALLVGFGVAWFILPRLAVVFSQMRLQLPPLTVALMRSGAFLSVHGYWFVPSFFGAMGLFIHTLFVNHRTKHWGEPLIFNLPGISDLLRDAETARFGHLLGSLLATGIPIVRALEILEGATTFRRYAGLYGHLRNMIEDGNSFAKSFGNYDQSRRLIPFTAQQIIFSAERSGRLTNSLQDIGRIYSEKAENSTKSLATILEPLLLVIVWLAVVAVAVAIILPLYSLIGGLRR
jgi:type II secretory pathway component PulF